MDDILITEKRGHVTVLTLNRPEAMNSLDYELYDALEDAVRTSDARAIVIRATGGNLRPAADRTMSNRSFASRLRLRGGLNQWIEA